MKKILLVLLTGVLLLTGCTPKDGVPQKNGMTVVTTNFFLYDMAKTILGDAGEAIMLITPGTESHDFELTLSDMAKIETCDLFVFVGGEGEGWVWEALDTFGTSGVEIPTFCVMEVVEQSGTLCHNTGEHDHDHDNHTATHWEGIDDHVWLSIPNAQLLYNALQDALQERYGDFTPTDTDISDTLTMLDEKYRTLVQETAKPFLLVADRFPYRYLTETYGISHTAAFDGCTSDTEPSLETVNRLVAQAKGMDKPMLAVTELSDRRTAEAVAAQVPGTEIVELHSCHNVTKADFDSGVTYADLLVRNYEILEKLWK